jgi:hypothetical protein
MDRVQGKQLNSMVVLDSCTPAACFMKVPRASFRWTAWLLAFSMPCTRCYPIRIEPQGSDQGPWRDELRSARGSGTRGTPAGGKADILNFVGKGRASRTRSSISSPGSRLGHPSYRRWFVKSGDCQIWAPHQFDTGEVSEEVTPQDLHSKHIRRHSTSRLPLLKTDFHSAVAWLAGRSTLHGGFRPLRSNLLGVYRSPRSLVDDLL